tara:strand:- start:1605 stop:2138 length:534 start_codon:yes stop_codon:yes gene_type:complete
MKKLFLLILLLSTFLATAQENFKKPFFTGSFNTTFAINPNYTLDPDDGEMLLQPSSFLFRLGIGYQFDRRWLVGLHAGYDRHFRLGISAIPTFGKLTYNIMEDADDTFFISTSYGKMWRPSSEYEDGNYYGLGIGWQIAGEGRWNTVVKIDFHRKKIANFKKGNLDSVSLGIGFSLF